MFKHRIRNSIQYQLSLLFLLLSLVTAIITAGIMFYDSYSKTHQLQDSLLRKISAYINPNDPLLHARWLNRGKKNKINDDDNDDHIYIQTKNTPPSKHFIKLTKQLDREGFHTVHNGSASYRVYIRNTPQGHILVMQENEYRQSLAFYTALHSALPFLIFIPIMIILTVLTIRRSMRPVKRLSTMLEQRQQDDLTPLPLSNIPLEIRGFIVTINRLLTRSHNLITQQKHFIADAAHELRSPMTALSLQADLFNTDNLSEEQQQQFAQLQKIIKRNRTLLEQLLSLARMQAPTQSQALKQLNTQAIFKNVIEDLYLLSSEKEQDLGVSNDITHYYYGDETDLYTLVKTLVDNAIRYTPTGSQIDLYSEENQDYLILCVEDNGTGIPLAERERVLDPFYRILGNQQLGTGLGLSIANTICKRYGGHIDLLDSKHFSQGLLAQAYLRKNHHLISTE